MSDTERWRAVAENDRSCDGRFCYGVRTTGIFCRPSCASRRPRRENVVFFDSAADALAAGYRPCKRCRPDQAECDPAAELAARARAVIDRDFAQRSGLPAGLDELGVTRRHLTGVFERVYGLSPEQYAARVRLERAKALLADGLKVTDVAFAVGMESAASFSTFFKKQAGVSPSEYAARRVAERPFRCFETPLGAMRVEADARGVTSLYFADAWAEPGGTGETARCLADAEAQVVEYFSGRRRSFDLPLSLSGSDFQLRVWRALAEIPYGETRSYGAVAAALGNPGAARAVGMANNRNPVLIVIPCHRVVGRSGQLVGYAGGIDRKRYMLELEAAHRANG